jgi:hypothetical protein
MVAIPVRRSCSCGLTLRPRPEPLTRGVNVLYCPHCDTPCKVSKATCELCKKSLRTVHDG